MKGDRSRPLTDLPQHRREFSVDRDQPWHLYTGVFFGTTNSIHKTCNEKHSDGWKMDLD